MGNVAISSILSVPVELRTLSVQRFKNDPDAYYMGEPVGPIILNPSQLRGSESLMTYASTIVEKERIALQALGMKV